MKNLCLVLFLLLIPIVVTADPPDPNQYYDADVSNVGNCRASAMATRYVNGPFPNGTTDWWCQSSASHKGSEDVDYILTTYIENRVPLPFEERAHIMEKPGTFHGDGHDYLDDSATLRTTHINWSQAQGKCGGAYAIASQVEDVLPWDPLPLPGEINNNSVTPPTPGISVSDSEQTPQPGDSITLNLVTSEPYYDVTWYVHTPWDTSSSGTYQGYTYGGGASTEASLSYTFPSGAMHTGNFTFRAVNL